MSIKINYKGAEILSYDENGTKTLKTGGKYCEGDISITNTQDGGITPTGTIEITENGTYDVTEKAEAVVNVASSGGNPYEKLNEFSSGTLIYYKNNTSTKIPFSGYQVDLAYPGQALRFVSFVNATSCFFGTYRTAQYIMYANFGKCNTFVQLHCPSSMLKTLILRNKTMATLGNRNSFSTSAKSTFYVPDTDESGNDLPAQYKTATNWSVFADKIKGYSEAPDYSATTTYNIGDVCKYNGKFYGYCKEDLTSSTGNAPTGTENDNAYWEFVDNI